MDEPDPPDPGRFSGVTGILLFVFGIAATRLGRNKRGP